MMQMEFREGRAQKAAQLHSISRLDPQGEFREGGVGDKWEERGEQGIWIRVHRTPRVGLFNPCRVPRGPGRRTRLSSIRETIGIDETGRKFSMSDDWLDEQAPRALPKRWTGMTVFHVEEFDDLKFGKDQRRQRGNEQSSKEQPSDARPGRT